MADTTGQVNLRAENVSAIVTGFALQSFKLKPLCMIQPSSSWLESYYKESKAELTGGTGAAVRQVPRLSAFPYGEVSWTKATSYLEKYGMDAVISWEDATTNNIDVVARTLLRVGRAVAYAIDSQIATELGAVAGGNTFSITAGYEWDSAVIANRDPIADILKAIRYLADDNYDALGGNGHLLLNPTDYEHLLSNTKIINNPTFKTADPVSNGVVGQICGLNIVVSPAIQADTAYVLIAKECMTWKEAKALTTITIEDPGIKYTIRAWEVGVLQITNPEAICKISNTAAA